MAGFPDIRERTQVEAQVQPCRNGQLQFVRQFKLQTQGAVLRLHKVAQTSKLIVLFEGADTRAMGPEDADYAVSFAVPANADGLSLYVSGYGGGAAAHDAFGPELLGAGDAGQVPTWILFGPADPAERHGEDDGDDVSGEGALVLTFAVMTGVAQKARNQPT